MALKLASDFDNNTGTILSTLIKVGLIFLLPLCICVAILFIPPSFDSKNQVFNIEKGMSIDILTKQLHDKNLIRSKTFFKFFMKLRGLDRRLQAGNYQLNPNYNLFQTLDTLEGVGGVQLIKVTIPEGFSTRQISKRLEALEVISSANAFNTYIQNAKSKFDSEFVFLEWIPTENLEGYLFPETYLFAKNTSYKKITRTMLSEFEKRLLPIWKDAPKTEGSPKKRFNFHKVVTMASIIQKEATQEHEMATISSVFYNRLKKLMTLSSDPTVVYAMGLDTKPVVLYKDLKIDSPYNTYKYPGFPPTPIAAPGKAAFQAAVYPKNTPYLFFVSNKDGTHAFTKTYADH